MKQKSYQINIIDTGKAFFCGEDEFLLEAMMRSRCGPISYGCFGGGCGVCKMRINSGTYFPEKRMSRAHVTEEEAESGIVLICCVKPRSDMEISSL